MVETPKMVVLMLLLVAVFGDLAEGGTSTTGVCKTVVWLSNDVKNSPERCFDLGEKTYWYGGGSLDSQTWPIDSAVYTDNPQVTGGESSTKDANRFHNRVWFSSDGFAVKVEDNVPLFVNVTNKKLCFRAENKYPFLFNENIPPTLSYAECYAPTVKDLFQTMMPIFFEMPKEQMPEGFNFRYPVWNTHPRFRFDDFNNRSIHEYVSNVTKHLNLKSGTLIVGHGWDVCSGDFQFKTANYFRPKDFVNGIRDKGFLISLQVHPHVDRSCNTFTEGVLKGYFVRDKNGDVAAFSTWDAHMVASVDFTVKHSSDWWTGRLRDLQKRLGFHSFYFDRGQTSLLPLNSSWNNGVPLGLMPDFYTMKYAEAAASLGNKGFINVGRNSQKHPILTRMIEKNATFSGLKTVLPSLFQMGISGFLYPLPEVIGGSTFVRPDKRLYIRWMELSTLLPAMHFSVGPWEYDDQEVVRIAKKMLQLRNDNIDVIEAAIQDAKNYNTPMVRPLLWAFPNENSALTVDDQFMVGDNLMVAPIVDNTNERHIYFPRGTWMDNLKKTTMRYAQPVTLYSYKVNLDELATFTRMAP